MVITAMEISFLQHLIPDDYSLMAIISLFEDVSYAELLLCYNEQFTKEK
jgi:hypothetical protein